MTTIKELKELDAKATKAPWHYEIYPERRYFQVETDMDAIVTNSCCYNDFNDSDPKLIAATRNALPDLIRVIELAEKALNSVVDDYDDKGHGAVLVNALSEIRKLKGE